MTSLTLVPKLHEAATKGTHIPKSQLKCGARRLNSPS